MLVDDVVVEQTDCGGRLSAAVHSCGVPTEDRLYFLARDADVCVLSHSGNPFVPALLLPAMARGEELDIAKPVSHRLLWGARSAMDLYREWWHLEPVRVSAAEDAPKTGGEGIGLFFTAGVDSYYSLLKDIERSVHPDHEPITHLIFANVTQAAGEPYDRLLATLRRVARETGKQLLIVETNVRTLTERTVGWPEYHGAALASVALALEGVLGKCLLASSDHHRYLPPWGSHPLLDPLWSTSRFEFAHDGIEASRVEKVARRVAGSPLALETLMVCWRDRPDRNCGVCAKCINTMIELELAGVLGRCRTLPTTLNLTTIAGLCLSSLTEWEDTRQLADYVRQQGRHNISDALDHALSRTRPDDAQVPWWVTIR